MSPLVRGVATLAIGAFVACSGNNSNPPAPSLPVYTQRVEQMLPLQFFDDIGAEWIGITIEIPFGETLDLPEWDMWEWGSKTRAPEIEIASDTSVHRAYTLATCDSAPWTTVLAVIKLPDGQVATCEHAGGNWDDPPEYFVHRVINLGIHHVYCDFRVNRSPAQPIFESLQAGVAVCESLHIFGVPRGRPQPLY